MTTRAPIRWGILGTGRIAGIFAEGLRADPEAVLVAVGSRSAESAQRFASKYNVARAHATYAASSPMIQSVDAIYVAYPDILVDMEETLRCIAAGKAVLCEKPFAVNAATSRYHDSMPPKPPMRL
jgi:predicted dehydrogenase